MRSDVIKVAMGVMMASNNRMQRGGLYKVVCRGRMNAVLEQVLRARVPWLLWPRAEAGR